MTVITVSQLNRYVKSLLEGDANLACVMLSGEISNFVNHYKSGHWYLSLKDENALVRAVMFRSSAARVPFVPENGMKVIVRARVSLYEKDGSFQIYLDDMQPDGAGALQVAYEQLKRRLEEEGLFDESRKRPLPPYPKRVGVITSDTGAAVRDIFNVLRRRYPLAEVVLIPTLVQGDSAPAQLCAALRQFEAMKAVGDPRTPDVILIGRGGGSLEELWAFNDEQLARTVAAATIPIISCVGHETDFTICDFVADLRAPTPSAAAELAVPDITELRQRVALLGAAAGRAVGSGLVQRQRRLTELSAKRCLSTPLYPVEERAMRLDRVVRRFSGAAQRVTAKADTRLATAAGKLDALSPLRVLSRGYALAGKGGAVLRSAAGVQPGDDIQLRLHDGELDCRVMAAKPIKET
ncbi:MAG: exodeoxyribonuclease VII large subunit [Clostridia bacterium]|nr:exodeoxyribonuclease VII large subunit [Clostridia bacterium]